MSQVNTIFPNLLLFYHLLAHTQFLPPYSTVSTQPLSSPHMPTQPLFTTPSTAVYTMTPPHTVTTGPVSGSTTVHPHQIIIPQPVYFTYPGQIHVYSNPSHNPLPFIPQSPTHNQQHFNTRPKIEFPKFVGTDPKGWVIKANQYFEFINMNEFRKVKLAGLHFEGKASVWYRFYHSSRSNVAWKVF